MSYTPTLRTKYQKEILPKLMEQFKYKSIMQVPKITKVAINQGLGEGTQDKKLIDIAVKVMSTIAGQKVVPTMARLSISNFKLREGQVIGARVTLRGDRMYEFLERLINVSLPRVRDFRGVNDKSFDGRGNYTLGVKEQIIFPEISLEKVKNISGMNITIVTSAGNDEEGYELLKSFGMPFASSKK